MSEPTLALEVEQLASGYGGAMILNGISFQVSAGKVLTIIGKNGMGKSTLLKTIMGLLSVRSGRVRIYGSDTTGLAAHKMIYQGVAYTPQDQAIFQDLTVDENLRLGFCRGESYKAEFDRVAAHFPFLADRQKQRAGTLSGGEQKMLLVARALLSRPRLMLIDEVTEGLQPSVVRRLTEVLRGELCSSGLAILLIEQNVNFALATADHYAVLTRGEIVGRGIANADAAEAIRRHLTV